MVQGKSFLGGAGKALIRRCAHLSTIGNKLIKKKIKVCHVITKMVYGGASLGTLHLVKSLNPRLFECSIICGTQSENEGDLLSKINASEFHVMRIPEMVREINPIKDGQVLLKLVTIMKKNKYDIVHTHGSKAGVIGRLAAAISRVPVILYTVHGWGLKVGDFMTRILFRFIEKMVASFTTKILFQTTSDMQEAALYSIGRKQQYILIGNGINLIPFFEYDKNTAVRIRKELSLEDKKIVGTVGRVSEQKNPTGFIDIACEVLKVRNDVVFIFAGGGDMLGKMRRLVNKLHLESAIHFLGARNDIPELVANFDLFILPSLWEGMPRSVIEAMALSKPVIVNKIGGIEEIVQDRKNGLIVDTDQLAVFVDKIKSLLDNPRLCRNMGRYGKAKAAEFDFDKVVAKTEAVYRELTTDTVKQRWMV